VARQMLRQAAERVEAVTLVHRRLYNGDDVEFVEMDDYLAGLVEEMQRATQATDAGGGDPARQIELTVDPIRVETDKAVPIGLIVNELVTNALKYAYPREQAGQVRIRLQRDTAEEGEMLRLVVEDDGVGYPDEDAAPKGSGLGSLIVGSMAQSLRATVVLDRAHQGTRFVVSLAG